MGLFNFKILILYIKYKKVNLKIILLAFWDIKLLMKLSCSKFINILFSIGNKANSFDFSYNIIYCN